MSGPELPPPRIHHAASPEALEEAERLFARYRHWLDSETAARYDENVDVCGLSTAQPASSPDYQPPRGRLLLAEFEGEIGGIGALRPIGELVGEIKHMFVLPEFRGRGLARALLERLVEEARSIGYERLRLDTTEFMTAAHGLYRSVGFRDIEPYGDHARFAPLLLFMELVLSDVPERVLPKQ